MNPRSRLRLRRGFALSKSYATARNIRLGVSTRRRLSFFCLAHLRARNADPNRHLVRDQPLSICQLGP